MRVAADAAARDLAVQQQRGSVVRAAGAEIRRRDDAREAVRGLATPPAGGGGPRQRVRGYASRSNPRPRVQSCRDPVRRWPEATAVPSASVLPITIGRRGRRRGSRAAAARGSCASLRPPGLSPDPRRIRAANRGSSGKVMPTSRCECRAARDQRADSEIAQRLHQVVVGLAGTAMPSHAFSRAPLHAVQRGSSARIRAPPPGGAVHFVLQRQRDTGNQPRIDCLL